jgi:hypothetical protein
MQQGTAGTGDRDQWCSQEQSSQRKYISVFRLYLCKNMKFDTVSRVCFVHIEKVIIAQTLWHIIKVKVKTHGLN